MRTKTLMGVIALSLLTISCSTINYYQLYKTSSTSNLSKEEKGLVYEDQNCTVTYNLWNEGGDAGFKFYNKTDESIYLNMEESYFILNDIANNYYGNRIITRSSEEILEVSKKTGFSTTSFGIFNTYYSPQLFSIGTTSAAGVSSSQGHSISYTEEKVVVIPAKTAKIIAEYSINNAVIRNCELLRYPKKKQVKPVSYSSANSPLTFSNRITYKVGDGSPIKFENSFYISEVTNYPSEEFFETVKEKDCEGKSKSNKIYKYAASDAFYVTYVKANDGVKY